MSRYLSLSPLVLIRLTSFQILLPLPLGSDFLDFRGGRSVGSTSTSGSAGTIPLWVCSAVESAKLSIDTRSDLWFFKFSPSPALLDFPTFRSCKPTRPRSDSVCIPFPASSPVSPLLAPPFLHLPDTFLVRVFARPGLFTFPLPSASRPVDCDLLPKPVGSHWYPASHLSLTALTRSEELPTTV